MATLSSSVDHSTVVVEASPAPTMPPISACDDDDGMPKYQVMRFQVIAPTRAAMTIVKAMAVVASASLRPGPTRCR